MANSNATMSAKNLSLEFMKPSGAPAGRSTFVGRGYEQ